MNERGGSEREKARAEETMTHGGEAVRSGGRGCQDKTKREKMYQKKQTGEQRSTCPGFPPAGFLFGGLPLPCLAAERWERKKNTWVKWCEKERLRAAAASTEEMTFLWRRRPLSFIWWDGGEGGSELKKVWKRQCYEGWKRSKGRWRGQKVLCQMAGIHFTLKIPLFFTPAFPLSLSPSLSNLSQFS